MPQIYAKDPQAVVDYTLDWTNFLAGDTLATSTWLVPDDLTIGTGAKAPTNDTTSATVWISDGVAGKAYVIVNRITTTDGRTDDRSIQLILKEE